MVLDNISEGISAFNPRRWVLAIPAAILFTLLLLGGDLLFTQVNAAVASVMSAVGLTAATAPATTLVGWAVALAVVGIGFAAHEGKENLLDDLAMLFVLIGTASVIGAAYEPLATDLASAGLFSVQTALVLGTAYFSIAVASRLPVVGQYAMVR